MLLRLAASSIKINTRLLPSIKQFHTSSFISNVNKSRTDPFSPNYDKRYSENLLKFQTETPTPDFSSFKSDSEKDSTQNTKKLGLIKTIKSGGAVSITLWVVWNFAFLGLFYILSAFGFSKALIDFMQEHFKEIDVKGLEDKLRGVYGAWMGTNFIIALILQKLAAPVRIGSYLAVLPFVVKLFKRK